jgi:hypothetical protein
MSSFPRVGRLPYNLPATPISPADSASYSRDLIESLRKIALGQRQMLLAHLLGLAALEAKSWADQAHETLPPG